MRLFCKTIATLALASTLHPSQVMALLKNDRLMLPIVEQVRQPDLVTWKGDTKRLFGEKILVSATVPGLIFPILVVVTDKAVHFLEQFNGGLREARECVPHGLSKIIRRPSIDGDGTVIIIGYKAGVIGVWQISTDGETTQVYDASKD